MRARALTLGLAFAWACIAASSEAADAPAYRVIQKIEVGGDGGWDYLTVDSAARRLYVTHGTRVIVLDADKGTVIGEIPNTEGVHGVALAPEIGKGFTSNGRSSTITIFDLATLKLQSQVASTGQNPDAILYDAASRRVFAFNGRTSNATAIDAGTGAVAGTIALSGKPEFAAADGHGRVFVNIEDKSTISVIDAQKLTVEKNWPLAPCEEPSGMAIDREHQHLFVGCHNKMMAIVDAVSGKVVGTVPIGERVDANSYEPATGFAFASCGDGTLTIARAERPNHYVVAQTVATQRGARTMALDEKTHRIFLATAQFGPPPSPTADNPRPRPSLVPGSFVILVVGQ
jgi:DNA-binding beta-propeller fold protein YncE